MAFQLVSLLSSLLVAAVWGQYPMMPGLGASFGSPFGFHGGFNQNQHQQQVSKWRSPQKKKRRRKKKKKERKKKRRVMKCIAHETSHLDVEFEMLIDVGV